jgi:hypothetical protein
MSGAFNEFKHLKAKVDAISEELSELRSFTKDAMVTSRTNRRFDINVTIKCGFDNIFNISFV